MAKSIKDRYKEMPNLTERQKIEGYIAHKWGLSDKLSDNHPFKINPPST